MRQKKSAEVLEAAVDFLSNPEISTTLAWGSKVLTVAGTRYIVEARYRTQNRQRLWEKYEALVALKPASERIGRTLFYQIANAITAPDLKVCNGALSSCRNLQYVHMD
jgi:hypothetical protein